MKEESPNQQKKNKLKEEYENLMANQKFEVKQHFPTEKDLPGLGQNQEIHDYAADMAECREKASQMVMSLIKLHLGEDPKVMNHPMIIEKIEEDVDSYAYLKFMAKQSQRLYINNLSNMDNGQIGAGMTEAISSLQKEQRDTLKMLSQKFKEIDLSYRMLKDILLSAAKEEVQEETQILDFKKMNSAIDQFMKERDEQKKLEQKNKIDKIVSTEMEISEETTQDEIEPKDEDLPNKEDF